jgi:hypothetical protein
MGRTDMYPVLRRKIVEGQQGLSVLRQALDGLRIALRIGGHESVKGHLGPGPIRRHPNHLQTLFGLSPHVLGQLIQDAVGLMHPAALTFRLTVGLQ